MVGSKCAQLPSSVKRYNCSYTSDVPFHEPVDSRKDKIRCLFHTRRALSSTNTYHKSWDYETIEIDFESIVQEETIPLAAKAIETTPNAMSQ